MNYNDGIILASKYAYSTNAEDIYINGRIYEVVYSWPLVPQYKVFRDVSTGECVMAFSGTSLDSIQGDLVDKDSKRFNTAEVNIINKGLDSKIPIKDGLDLVTDVQLIGDSIPAELESALKHFNDMKQRFPNLTTVVGNSLGGALANYVALNSPGIQSITYNPAMLPGDAINNAKNKGIDIKAAKITNFISDNDILDAAQKGSSFKDSRMPGRCIDVHSGTGAMDTFAYDHIGFHNVEDYNKALKQLKFKVDGISPDKDKEFRDNQISFIDMGENMPLIIDPRLTLPINPFSPKHLISDNIDIKIDSNSLQNLEASMQQFIEINSINKYYIDAIENILNNHVSKRAQIMKKHKMHECLSNIFIDNFYQFGLLDQLGLLGDLKNNMKKAFNKIDNQIETKILKMEDDKQNFLNLLNKNMKIVRNNYVKYMNKLNNFKDQVQAIAVNYEEFDSQIGEGIQVISEITPIIQIPIPETNLEIYESMDINLFKEKQKKVDMAVDKLISNVEHIITPIINILLNILLNKVNNIQKPGEIITAAIEGEGFDVLGMVSSASSYNFSDGLLLGLLSLHNMTIDDFENVLLNIKNNLNELPNILNEIKPILRDIIISSEDYDIIVLYLSQMLNVFRCHYDTFKYIFSTIGNSNLAKKVLNDNCKKNMEFLYDFSADIDTMILHNGDVV